MVDRDAFGRLVREAWVTWAKEQPNPKSSWLVPYDDLPEVEKEADRRIAEAVVLGVFVRFNTRRIELIHKDRLGEGLSPSEKAEFKSLQDATFEVLDLIHPRPPHPDWAKLEELEQRLENPST